MAIVGYARVSSIGQSLDVQLDKLSFCDKIFQEKISGVDSNRPALNKALDYLREGDVLVITHLDRLARSTLDLCNIVKRLDEQDVSLRVLDQNIDTSDATGRLIFHVLASIGQFETEIRKERQMDGIAKAKKKGVHFGRKPALNNKQIKQLKSDREEGYKIKELMSKYKLSKSVVYKYLAA
jgi:DNA invertase Pin-like site-specific DNA recombinase